MPSASNIDGVSHVAPICAGIGGPKPLLNKLASTHEEAYSIAEKEDTVTFLTMHSCKGLMSAGGRRAEEWMARATRELVVVGVDDK